MPSPKKFPVIWRSHSTRQWACAPNSGLYTGSHGRWTGLLLMAELSVGHASFGEPRWVRDSVFRPDGESSSRWVLQWPCRACKAWFTRPAAHRQHHLDADRIRVARMTSFGPFDA